MRKHLISSFLGSVCLLLLCGCSNDDRLSDAESMEQYDPVEISLKSHNGSSITVTPTRAALVGNEDIDIPDIGVFGLAREIQDINNSPIGPGEDKWFAPTDNWSAWILNNVKSHKEGYNIVWDDPKAM